MIRKLDQNRIYQGLLLKEMIVTRKREVLNR